ncbi:MAG TPA: hypothetical protein PKL54_15475, partial [Candidatus Hydrogenedentes bacterium]|nr:hypothetical protein [Candidatus Hydrogenedentota bacterium]
MNGWKRMGVALGLVLAGGLATAGQTAAKEEPPFILVPSDTAGVEVPAGTLVAVFALFENGAWRGVDRIKPDASAVAPRKAFRLDDPNRAYTLKTTIPARPCLEPSERVDLLYLPQEPGRAESGHKCAYALTNQPARHFPIKSAREVPHLEALCARMLKEAQPLEEALRKECEINPDNCWRVPYDPTTLQAPELDSVTAFELAPDLPGFFVVLRRSPAVAPQGSPPADAATYWTGIVGKESPEPLWERCWLPLDEKAEKDF